MPEPGSDSDLRRGDRPHVYLHIGAMKTGTTFLQHLLNAHREPLTAAGFGLPTRPAYWLRQVNRSADPDAGDGLVRAVVEHPGPSIVSWEFLSFADRGRAERLLARLDGAEAEVVLTIRDAARTLPAQWQTKCRNGGTMGWQRFLEDVDGLLESGRPSKSARVFRRSQDIGRMLDVWVPLLGPERVHVVTVPPKGSDPMLLWRRFADVVGADPALTAPDDVPSNPTLGWPSSELLRRLNTTLGKRIDKDQYQRVVRGVVARLLERRVPEEPGIQLTPLARSLAARWNAATREAVLAAGVPVVGTLEDLPDTADGEPDADVTPPRRPELLAAATTARDGLLRLEALLVDGRKAADAVTETTSPGHWGGDRPVRAAVAELADRVVRCAELDTRKGRLGSLTGFGYAQRW